MILALLLNLVVIIAARESFKAEGPEITEAEWKKYYQSSVILGFYMHEVSSIAVQSGSPL